MTETPAFISLADLPGLDSDATLVLTVNNRYARRIIAEFSAGLSDAHQVMALPDIVPLSAWLRQASDQLSFIPGAALASHALDAFGARHLWQRVIAQAEADHALLDVRQAARLAMEADRLLCDWQLQVRPEDETGEYQRFRVWRELYRARLASLDAEDSNLGYERVSQAAMNGQLSFPFRTLVLAGFNEFAPRFEGLIRVMAQQGIGILTLQPEAARGGCKQRVVAADPDAEWRLAAQWAVRQLRGNPQGRYAIVAARLETDVVLAHRVLREALKQAPIETQAEIPASSETDPFPAGPWPALPYNVALARPLSDWPLVRAAIAWLRVFSEFSQKKTCEPAVLGQALLAGACVADAAESSGRAMIDALWRKQARVKISRPLFAEQLARMAPRLGHAWDGWVNNHGDSTAPASIDAWVARFRQWLQDLGFPGQSSLDSHSYQVVEAFDALLTALGKQTVVLGTLAMGAAVGLLDQLARETPFQPQRDPTARLDVLGLLESEGGRWDGVWVLGLTDEVLPAAPKPNPLIPLAVLRRAQAPRATPERELQWAQGMYEALANCAPEVWFSHAGQEGERMLRASPCIIELPVVEPAPPPAGCGACRLESLVDAQGPALQPGQVTRGGIGVIDTQARNPLWAFVKYRLGASQLTDYADIADQNARGIFLHRAIELVWRMALDQPGLQQLHDDGRLVPLVEQCVQQAAGECLQDYGRVMKALETARAMGVIDGWLAFERSRPPFAVQDLEKTFQWAHGALELSLRLDRIDALDDGRLAVIDYKSGGGAIDPKGNWMRSRPVGLQLPFYAAVLAEGPSDVAALILAKLHAKKIEVKGLADSGHGFGGVASLSDWPAFAHYDWSRLMAEWRQAIGQLAFDYSSGRADNRSENPADLDYCDVLPFLRLNEEAGHAA